jgi:hypothetical protein
VGARLVDIGGDVLDLPDHVVDVGRDVVHVGGDVPDRGLDTVDAIDRPIEPFLDPVCPVVEFADAGRGVLGLLGDVLQLSGDLAEALGFANAVAALTTTVPGAMTALPTRTDVTAFRADQA